MKLVHEIASCEKRAKSIISPNLEEYLEDIEQRMSKRGPKMFDGGLSNEIINMTEFLSKLLKDYEVKSKLSEIEKSEVEKHDRYCFKFLILAVAGVILIFVVSVSKNGTWSVGN